MGLPWIQVDKTFLEAQALKLSIALGVPKPYAAGCMNYLWKFCEESGADRFEGEGFEQLLCEAAQWAGPKDKFLKGLVRAELAEAIDDGIRIRGCDRYEDAKAKEKARRDADRERKRQAKRAQQAQLAEADSARIPHGIQTPSSGIPPDSTAQMKMKIEIKKEEKHTSESAAEPPVCAPEQVQLLPTPRPEELQALWNELAAPCLPRWRDMTSKRAKKVATRMRERPLLGPNSWRTVIERINASPFCRGESKDGWRASPDWLLQADTASKVLEGSYDARGTGPPSTPQPMRRLEAGEDPYAMEAM